MTNDSVVMRASLAEQHPQTNHAHDKSTPRRHSNARLGELIELEPNGLINEVSPPELELPYVSFYLSNHYDAYFTLIRAYNRLSTQLTTKSKCAFVLFTSLVIMTGTLIVYYTSPKPAGTSFFFLIYVLNDESNNTRLKE